MLRVEEVWKRYESKRRTVQALAGVSFSLEQSRCLALVGESGAGKSTLARLIAGWEKPDRGAISCEGEAGHHWAQLIPQDPGPSLNPYRSVLEIVEEPLILRRRPRGVARELLHACEVPSDLFARRSRELSGGQKARVAIARGLAAFPRVVILDESMASVDLITRAQLTRLLLRLQQERGFACLWILHDLDFAGQVAGEIAVLCEGRIVEHLPVADFVHSARHPAALALLAARRARGNCG